MDLNVDENESVPISHYLTRIPAAIKAANHFNCALCPHHGPDQIWPEFADTTSEPSVTRTEVEIIKDELRCFHTRVHYTEDVLGIGLKITRYNKNRGNGVNLNEISSPLDLLSRRAFFEENVREGVYETDSNGDKMKITDWMPLYICEDHGNRALPLLRQSLCRICDVKRFRSELALTVLTKLMNTMVVNVMKGRTVVSHRALGGYIAFHRLLIFFVMKDSALKAKINSDFIQSEDGRTKQKLPSLGDFLAMLSVSDYIREAYMDESLTRNVFWVLRKYPMLGESDRYEQHRNSKTFLASRVSLQLLLFHVHFLSNFGRSSGKTLSQIADDYDSKYGRPTNDMKEVVLRGVQEIKNIKTWDSFFQRIGIEPPSEEELTARLCASVKKSLLRGYHKGRHGGGSHRERKPRRESRLQKQLNARAQPFRPQPQYDYTTPSFSSRTGGRGRGTFTRSQSGRGRGRPVKPKEQCIYYKDGVCPHGDKCRFMH